MPGTRGFRLTLIKIAINNTAKFGLSPSEKKFSEDLTGWGSEGQRQAQSGSYPFGETPNSQPLL
jgi:hypothetical protein